MRIKIIILGLISLFLLSCSPDKKTGRPEVVVSILPEKYFAQALLDSIADVHVLVPPGAKPESFDPTTQAILKLRRAAAYFYMGSLQAEKQILKSLESRELRIVDLSTYLPEALQTEACQHTCSQHTQGDPHYWTSILGAQSIAKGMYQSLVEVFPEHTKQLKANYELLQAKIVEVKDSLTNRLENLSARSFIIYHPSLSYFSTEWKLQQIAIEQNGKSPSAKQIHQLIDEARAQKVKVVLVQKNFDPGTTERLAQELGARTVVIDPLSADWDREMIHIAKALSDTVVVVVEK